MIYAEQEEMKIDLRRVYQQVQYRSTNDYVFNNCEVRVQLQSSRLSIEMCNNTYRNSYEFLSE